MALYEITFVARQDLSTQDVDKLTDAFSTLVTEQGGKVIKKEYWGLRTLAYKINKNRKGHYVHLGVEASGDTVKELRRKFGINEDIIRSLSVRVEEINKAPSQIMRDGPTASYSESRGSRGDGPRGDRGDRRGGGGGYKGGRDRREKETPAENVA